MSIWIPSQDILTDKMGITGLNEIWLNSMPQSLSNQAYVQVFDCEYILFKKSVNMFEQMDIAEYIYEGVVESLYKKY